jgi:hypothetical protein
MSFPINRRVLKKTTRQERLAHLKEYYLSILAEGWTDDDRTNFDGDVLDAIDDLAQQYPDEHTIKPEMRVRIDDTDESNTLIQELEERYFVKRIPTEDIIPLAIQGKDVKTGHAEIRRFFLRS